MDDIIKGLEKSKYDIKENVSFKTLTTYKTGGVCKYLISPFEVLALIELLKVLKENNIKFKIFGNGSNILASDKVYDGVIIRLDKFNKVKVDGDIVYAEAFVNLVSLSLTCLNNNLTGFEWASGIPGTVGGACYMNAGAYLKSVSDVLISVTVLDEDYNVLEIPLKDLEFGYRKSNLMDKGYIILGAKFKLSKGNYDDILNLITERRERRYKSQPLNYPSAGSVFRNPDGDYAGRLIEECNLKGYIKGGAKISDMHANFIVNYNNATSSDVKDLIELAKLKVHEKFNIDLKCEQELFNWE